MTSIATHSHPPGHCSGTRPGPPRRQTPRGSRISYCKHRCSWVFWNNTQALATKPWVKIFHKFFKLLLTISIKSFCSSLWASERVKETFIQNERLVFKNILNTKQTRLKQTQQPLLQNRQTPMQNKRSLMQNQQACTELPLDGVHRGIRRIRFLKKNKRTYPVENVPLTYRECFHARIQIFFSREREGVLWDI